MLLILLFFIETRKIHYHLQNMNLFKDLSYEFDENINFVENDY